MTTDALGASTTRVGGCVEPTRHHGLTTMDGNQAGDVITDRGLRLAGALLSPADLSPSLPLELDIGALLAEHRHDASAHVRRTALDAHCVPVVLLLDDLPLAG